MTNSYIRLGNQNEFFSEDNALQFLKVDRLNIILGANNSRKSRLIRYLLRQKTSVILHSPSNLNFLLEVLDNSIEYMEGQSVIKLIELSITGALDKNSRFGNIGNDLPGKIISTAHILDQLKSIRTALFDFTDADGFYLLLKNIKSLYDQLDLCKLYYETIRERSGLAAPPVVDENPNWQSMTVHIPGVSHRASIYNYDEVLGLLERIIGVIEELTHLCFEHKIHVEKVYIPALRSSHSYPGINTDIFEKYLRSQYDLNDEKIIIHTGMLLYENIITAKTGTRSQIKSITEFENFIGRTFFNSEVHITAHYVPGGSERKIGISLTGERADTPIYNLGDGIQSIINLLFPVFTARDNSLIFIDEPENHLHPGFQNIFIEALLSNPFIQSKRLWFLISSHSNHLLAGALMERGKHEVLYAKRRDEDTSTLFSFNGNEYDLLETLGVINTSVLVSNSMVWVEGVTDRLYVRAILKAYIDTLDETEFKPTEGLHYSFIEYAGKNLSHYSFDTKKSSDSISSFLISTNIFLIADTDFDHNKHATFRSINRSNFRFFETKLPEMENLLPEEILKEYFSTKSCTKQSLEECFPILENINNVKLGGYFQSKLVTQKGKELKIESDGGTLSSYYKMGLANFTYNHIFDGKYNWDILKSSGGLRSLCESLYQFIKEKNRKASV